LKGLGISAQGRDSCFLALAYGDVGELWAAIPLAIPHQVLEDRMRKGMSCFFRTVPRTPVFVNDVVDQAWSTSHSVSRLLGISAEQVDVISDYFEDDREGFTAHLAQWLQGRNVNAAIVIREARREAETELRLASRRRQAGERHAIQRAKLAETVG
jgi:hypothetical protein